MTPEQIDKLLVEVEMVELVRREKIKCDSLEKYVDNEFPELRQVKPVSIVMETKLSGHNLRSIANDPRPNGHLHHFRNLL
jgi:hypothetical protein